MTKYCPNCGTGVDGTNVEVKEWDEDGGEFSDDHVHLISIVVRCNKCFYGSNCISTRKVK